MVAAVGMTAEYECFVSPLKSSSPPSAEALVTRESGFPPSHPYHSGSGDHVNSTHLVDVARQFAHLLNPGKLVTVIGGEMTFKRFVELGHPIIVELVEAARSNESISLQIHQAGRHCADIVLHLRLT